MDVRTEREQRDLFAGTVLRAVAQGAGPLLRVTADDGTRPVVVAFDHELVSDVLNRVSWSGGYANLFVIAGEGKMIRASVVPPSASLDEGAAESLGLGAVHDDSTIGMLMANVSTARDGLTVQVRLPRNAADLSSISAPEPVPA
ncbi:hypothetical protein ES689_10670 [Frigoribacterium sp. ACAM 257]|jgi:hypothetical protein|uniref:hypothetical protein n=1 Tax=Frigoribacterium sp. ACAM 257 TaxID=2508998 RepID=UPI0011B9C92E|nr:hypothetical protein [Frigoribacterium sp. ACAM 257]TWX37137.1 hypothetical protein ES689_10670 [Frigoribacterium sp. ACAM 257]